MKLLPSSLISPQVSHFLFDLDIEPPERRSIILEKICPFVTSGSNFPQIVHNAYQLQQLHVLNAYAVVIVPLKSTKQTALF